MPPRCQNDAPITLYTQRIEEDPLSIALTAAGGWRSITSRPGAREISLDLSFDRGLAFYNDQGGRSNATVEFDAEYRAVGNDAWAAISWKSGGDAGFETAGKITITEASSSPVRRGGRFDLPDAGQYEVRLRRTTADATGPRLIDSATLSALRSITNDQPVTMSGLAMVALRLKAYEQINNQLQQISCLASSYLEVWNGSTWSWQLTRNPAWAYCDVLRRRGNTRLIGDERIDLTAIRAWAEACETPAQDGQPKWTFDGIVEGGSVVEALRDIASHARARYGIRDGKHSVVRDIPQTVPVLHITPRNSFNYVGRKQFIDLPHALKVRFINPDKDWQEDERIVYADGYSAENAARFETVDMMACTRAEQAWREGRYHLAVGRLRPETHEVYQDVEALRATDGDLGHAERREHSPGGEPETRGRCDERLDRCGIDRLGTAQGQRERGEVEALHAAERAGRQHPREVRAGRRRAAVVADPLHPVARLGHEVLRGRLHQLHTVGHRDGEEPDQTHVVVQREPTDHHLVAVELRRLTGCIDVGAKHPVRDHHSLGLTGGAARVLQDDQTLRIVRREFETFAAHRTDATGQHRRHRLDLWVAGGRLVERGEHVVDE